MAFKRRKEISWCSWRDTQIKQFFHRHGSLGKSDTKCERAWALLKTTETAITFRVGKCGVCHPCVPCLLAWSLGYHLVFKVEITLFNLLCAYLKSQMISYGFKFCIHGKGWEHFTEDCWLPWQPNSPLGQEERTPRPMSVGRGLSVIKPSLTTFISETWKSQGYVQEGCLTVHRRPKQTWCDPPE